MSTPAEHIHHYIPRPTGQRNAQRESIQEMVCDCGERPADAAMRRLDMRGIIAAD